MDAARLDGVHAKPFIICELGGGFFARKSYVLLTFRGYIFINIYHVDRNISRMI